MEKKLRLELLKLLEPNKKEELEEEKELKELFSKLERKAKENNITLKCSIGGSRGKKTYLKESSDIDIFVSFPLTTKEEELSKHLENILKELGLKIKKLKGSRDYFQSDFKVKGKTLKLEWVPTLTISEVKEARNSTDVSILHLDFLKEKIGKDKKLIEEIRLAKLFFKAKELYGAESYKESFSGHVLDLLILEYKSLENLLKEASNWQEGILLDPAKHYKNQEDARKELVKEKRSPLIVIDPILKERNAARALSKEHFDEFVLLCKKIKELKKEDFIKKKETAKGYLKKIQKEAKEKELELYALLCTLEPQEETRDKIGSQLLKLFRRLSKEIEEKEFRIFKEEFKYFEEENSIYFSFFLYEHKLPRSKIRKGPLLSLEHATEQFLKKYPHAHIEKGRLCVYEKRKVENSNQLHKNKKDLETLFAKKLPFLKKVERIK